jgi:DNA mismatch repair ATPase MutL
MAGRNTNQNQELFSFSANFLRDHAGHLITDPRTAITELIANAYDAGATAVDIIWPDDTEGAFSITDNGTGMTKAEFGGAGRPCPTSV